MNKEKNIFASKCLLARFRKIFKHMVNFDNLKIFLLQV